MNADEQRQLSLRMAALCGYPVETACGEPNRGDTYIIDCASDLFVERPESEDYCSEDWSPVTNPLQALEVAEAMRKQHGYHYSMCEDDDLTSPTIEWTFWRDDGPAEYSALGASLAEAICRAAAETLESEAGT